MTFKVQWLNKSKMWVTMMSGYRMEQEAIRYAEVRARQIRTMNTSKQDRLQNHTSVKSRVTFIQTKLFLSIVLFV